MSQFILSYIYAHFRRHSVLRYITIDGDCLQNANNASKKKPIDCATRNVANNPG
jgi:hypothetical protein